MRSLPAALLAACLACVLGACATRPINAPIAEVKRGTGYRLDTRQGQDQDRETLMILAFSGGGTRAAAFSYGVLEELRKTEVTLPSGRRVRVLDEVDVITGVSGGSFTALAYGLYGEKLFDDYDKRFLKRDVEGELLARLLSPGNWSALWSAEWGRSEMAAQLYDEILFDGATFRDLQNKPGPLIVATATDISTGSRLGFTQSDFDLLCSDVESVPLSRAAAASSAVPLVLSPVTINNYGGTCGFQFPSWTLALQGGDKGARPASRAMFRTKEMQSFQDSANRPYIHLVDGGLADNLGMRSVLEVMETIENAKASGRRTRLDDTRRIVIFVVNSLSLPRTDWDKSPRPPNDLMILLKATGVPIDRYSYEAIDLLSDLSVRWKTLRALGGKTQGGALAVPDIDVYAVDVSFAQLKDRKEADYLNDLPTSFVLPPEAVDRLRAAGASLVRESPDFARLLKDLGAAKAAP
ncbi:MAG: patatin-like phospholipase family protein [Burkholderiales bacterium]